MRKVYSHWGAHYKKSQGASLKNQGRPGDVRIEILRVYVFTTKVHIKCTKDNTK